MLVTAPESVHQFIIGVTERQPGLVVAFLKEHSPSFNDLRIIFTTVDPERQAEVAKILFETPVRPEWNEHTLTKVLAQIKKAIDGTHGGYWGTDEYRKLETRRACLQNSWQRIQACIAQLKEKRLAARIDSLEVDQLLNLVRQGKSAAVADEWERAVARANQFLSEYGPQALINRFDEESSAEVRAIISNLLKQKFNQCSADLLVLLVGKQTFPELVPDILTSLEQIGYDTAKFLDLRSEFSRHSELILKAIAERSDLPFEVVEEIFEKSGGYYEQGGAASTFAAVLPNLDKKQIQKARVFFARWNKEYQFRHLVGKHARKNLATEICLEMGEIPESLISRQDIGYEEMLDIFQKMAPSWYTARLIVERFAAAKQAAQAAA